MEGRGGDGRWARARTGRQVLRPANPKSGSVSRVKRQHYVPQFYLRNFSSDRKWPIAKEGRTTSAVARRIRAQPQSRRVLVSLLLASPMTAVSARHRLRPAQSSGRTWPRSAAGTTRDIRTAQPRRRRERGPAVCQAG